MITISAIGPEWRPYANEPGLPFWMPIRSSIHVNVEGHLSNV